MAAFSAPFWIIVTSASVLAAGVSYLAQPPDHRHTGASARALETLDHTTAALADVPAPPDTGDDTQPGRPSTAPRAASTFTTDSLGRLSVSDKTLPVLDSWLGLLGSGQPLSSLEARLRAELPPLAAERAWGLLCSYAAYREAERALLRGPASQGAPSSRELLDRTMALRRRHFDSVTVQELFGVQEARALYASDVARIFADTSLTEAQQAQRLLALRIGLPPAVAAQEFGGSQFSLALERQVAEMRAHGESDAEVVYLRKQFVDAEGEKSVLELEEETFNTERQAWALRHPAFIRQRDEILAADLDVADKQQRLDDLLRQQFSPDEIAKARTYGGV